MKFVLPLEKMRNETIKMIAEDLGCPVDFKDCVKEFMENGEVDTNKFDEVKKKHIAEVQKWLLMNDYIFDDNIYHVVDEDIYFYLLKKESRDTLMRMIEIYNMVDKLPVEDKLKKSILEECFTNEVYNRLAAGFDAYLEDNCWVDKNRD